MWWTIELRELRVFLALAQELHFGRAAERLGVTQSRVSQSLRELELKVGTALFHRTSRRVRLTAAGERFLAEIQPAYESLADSLRLASERGAPQHQVVRVGLLNAVPGADSVVGIIKAFEERHPGSSVEVIQLKLSDRFKRLRAGDVDVMVGPPPQNHLDTVTGPILAEDKRFLAVAVDHPLSARTTVSTEDIADYEVVDVEGLVPAELANRLIPQASASGKPIRTRRLRHHDRSELTTMIARGKVVHPTFAGQFADAGIRCIEISDLPVWTSVLVWRRDDTSLHLRRLVGVAEKLRAQVQEGPASPHLT